jgi:Gpi18-like mannosyltransferase
VVVLLVLYVAPVLKPGYRRISFFSDWDGTFYLSIARSGYPQLETAGKGFNGTAAFFPLLPLLTRGVHEVTRLSYRASGIAVANVAALAAFCVIWILFREVVGRDRATVGLALFAFWPASFVLSMVYSDVLLVLFASAFLLMLRREQWWGAFAFGVLAALSRPSGVLLAHSGAWVAYEAYRRRRNWLPWVAAVGPLIGLALFQLYLWIELDNPVAWATAQERGWHNGFDFGQTFWSHAFTALHQPTARIDLVISLVAGIIGIALVVWMIRIRLPAMLTIYAGGVVVLAVGSGFGGSIPRFCLDAFPIFLAPAAKLRTTTNTLLIGCSAATLVLLMLVVELTRTTTP